jgi:hypothetical protein
VYANLQNANKQACRQPIAPPRHEGTSGRKRTSNSPYRNRQHMAEKVITCSLHEEQQGSTPSNKHSATNHLQPRQEGEGHHLLWGQEETGRQVGMPEANAQETGQTLCTQSHRRTGRSMWSKRRTGNTHGEQVFCAPPHRTK